MSKFFINRPIVAIVIAILTVIIGLVSMMGLPVAQYPDIVPPQIQVVTNFVGADAQTVEQSVATPIEQQMSGVPGMDYMYSINANNGGMTLNVIFKPGTVPTTAQILAQLRLGQASTQLPAAVNNYGVTVKQAMSSPLGLFAVYSPSGMYDRTFLSNYCYINLRNPILRTAGVGDVTIFGSGQYAMRIWVEPDKMAALGITVPQVISAIQAQNNVNPAGQIGGEPAPEGQVFTYSVNTTGRLIEVADFENIILRATADGVVVRVKDVASVTLGSQYYNLRGNFNGQDAAVVAVYQQPGSNAVETMRQVKALMKKMEESFPGDLKFTLSMDTTEAVTEGMKEIKQTLFEAMALVILVVFVFLQGWRATLIPLIAVPVSLIGTFAFFPLLGFSINTLSLFGLVLAIGLVVDDAIVVVEAIEHNIEQGLAPREAAFKAMEQVSGPVIAIALILAAVFIPTVFISGISGSLYQQFAVTIAISVCISAFNALSLSPALGALLLRPRDPQAKRRVLGRFFAWFNKIFGVATNGYVSTSRWLIRKMAVTLVLLLAMTAVGLKVGLALPSGFIPDEDHGYIYGSLLLPRASSLQQTDKACHEAMEIIKADPSVEYVTHVVGFNLLSSVQATYSGFFFIRLAPWDKRRDADLQVPQTIARLNRKLQSVTSATAAFCFSPPAIPGIGTAGGVIFMLQDRSGKDVSFIAENTKKFTDEARKRDEIASLSSAALWDVPQIFLRVDEEQAAVQGVALAQAYQTMQAFLGGYFVNYFTRFGLQWQVYVQADAAYRNTIDNLGLFFVNNAQGQPVPISSFVHPEESYGPEFTMRFNMFRSSQINVNAAPGYSSAQVMRALEDVFKKTMPEGMGYDYSGMSFQERAAQQGVSPMAIFALSFVFVFLILAALYESWSLPFSVLLATPIAVFGAFGGLLVRGMENNIYVQIGLIMLIGLAAKNAILIVEFAKNEYEKGTSLMDATLTGARLRLRPILMTSFAFVFGCIPLAVATGAGAVSRQILGTCVIGGMLASTLIAIFIIPAGFYLVEKLTKKKSTE